MAKENHWADYASISAGYVFIKIGGLMGVKLLNKIGNKELVERRVQFLKSMNPVLSKKNLKGVLTGLDKTYFDDGDFQYVDQDGQVLHDVIIDINAGNNVLLIGPKASGKNTLIETLAKLYTRRIREIQCNAYTDLEALLGSATLKESTLVFEPSELVQAMEVGDFIVLDELNTVNPAVLSVLNSVLDGRRRISVPTYGLVKAHTDFRIFATMNEGYQGVVELNEATESRFAKHYLSLPEDISGILNKCVPQAAPMSIHHCNKLYTNMKTLVERGELSDEVINIRAFVMALERTLWDMPIKKALKVVAAAPSDEIERAAIELYIDTL